MDLGYPAGPYIQKAAENCEDHEAARELYPLPTPMKGRKELDFSFSGLKTAVRNHVQKAGDKLDKQALCSSLQQVMVEILTERTGRAIDIFRRDYPQGKGFVISGGVAANKPIRTGLEILAKQNKLDFYAPPLHLCGDNGVMIAWAGMERYNLNQYDELNVSARPRWPLDPNENKVSASGK